MAGTAERRAMPRAPAADRRPPRRPIGRARRLDRLGDGHRRRARATRASAVRQVLIDLDGGWWWLPRRPSTRRPPAAALRRPGGARRRRAGRASARRSIGWPPPTQRRSSSSAARPVRGGRHDPGAARRRRPGLHRLRGRRLGARAWTRRCSSGCAAGWACRSSTGARSAPGAGPADRAGVETEIEAFAAGAADPRLMVKPSGLGSSVGMTLVHEPAELGAGDRPRVALRHVALVEAYLAGARDLEVSVIGNDPARLEIFGPGEIVAGPRVLRLRREVHAGPVRDLDPGRGRRPRARDHPQAGTRRLPRDRCRRASPGSTSSSPASGSSCRRSTRSRGSRRSASSRPCRPTAGYTFTDVCIRIVELALDRHAAGPAGHLARRPAPMSQRTPIRRAPPARPTTRKPHTESPIRRTRTCGAPRPACRRSGPGPLLAMLLAAAGRSTASPTLGVRLPEHAARGRRIHRARARREALGGVRGVNLFGLRTGATRGGAARAADHPAADVGVGLPAASWSASWSAPRSSSGASARGAISSTRGAPVRAPRRRCRRPEVAALPVVEDRRATSAGLSVGGHLEPVDLDAATRLPR